MAEDSAQQVGEWHDLAGSVVVDVGGGPGLFRDAFRAKGATYLSVESDAGELAGLGLPHPDTVQGSGLALPLRAGSVDVVFSSNVLEHVPDPERFADELVRVARPGGTVFLSFTPWLSPWGGHETSPRHYLGGQLARAHYERRHGHPPKNVYGRSLFAVSVARMLRWTRRADADLVGLRARYHPWWAQWLTRLPLVREVATWNIVLVLRRH